MQFSVMCLWNLALLRQASINQGWYLGDGEFITHKHPSSSSGTCGGDSSKAHHGIQGLRLPLICGDSPWLSTEQGPPPLTCSFQQYAAAYLTTLRAQHGCGSSLKGLRFTL